MKGLVKKFIHRGLLTAAGGPVVLAIVYYFLGRYGVLQSLTVEEAVKGILTVTLMAFVAGGIPVVYEAERLGLLWATLIHALTLYADYLIIYLWNGWLKSAQTPVLVFTLIFFGGYGLIWLLIYNSVKAKVRRLNESVNGEA